MNLRNKVALITGGARMGRIIGENLAKRGCHVVLTYRSSRESADRAVRHIESFGVRSFAIKTDTTNPTSVKKTFSAIKKKFGSLHVLLNMASIYSKVPWTSLNEKSWHKIVDANLTSTALCCLYATPLLKRGKGRIVNISDWLSQSARPRYKDFVPYYTAKMGILGLTQALALELAPSVLVNSIAPGPILPLKGLSQKENRAVIKATPLRKWGGVEEIAKAVLYLMDSDFVTGESIRVDGGRHIF